MKPPDIRAVDIKAVSGEFPAVDDDIKPLIMGIKMEKNPAPIRQNPKI